ncbi:hypothetical protein ANMWB30_29370 [Arthrobacter sp. MWB30]|nr:hypothetical protein ANMWB30_29370 [Arthrobacter sp. MWB30]
MSAPFVEPDEALARWVPWRIGGRFAVATDKVIPLAFTT